MISKRNLILPLLAGATCMICAPAWAGKSVSNFGAAISSSRGSFQAFVRKFRATALKKGITAATYDSAMAGVRADPKVEELSANQPEFNTAIWDYLAKRVDKDRIARGRKMKSQYGAKSKAIEKRFGVSRYIFLAIWGMETNYGSYLGKKSVIRSLATFAYRGRRQAFGRGQLIAALKILQDGDVSQSRFVGSWAGAMGHTQFIPTSYAAHAVDWTGDGKRDVWNSVPDALASTANYLYRAGWRAGRPWGWEVKLPANFDYGLVGAGRRTVLQWAKLGLSPTRSKRFGVKKEKARLILPAGAKGPAFLVTANFKAILAYNSSTAYALGVSLLADKIAGKKGVLKPWPVNDKMLSRAQRSQLQKLLTAKGFDTGGQNGHLGRKTIAAIAAYQRKAGLPADGYVSLALLNHIKAGK